MLKVMLVEDDHYALKGLTSLLNSEGYQCSSFADAESAWEDCQQDIPDLCILDRALPGMSGDHLCRKLRHIWPALPILLLSGKGTESEKIEGLELGADDYISKPYSVNELLARVEAMCRRIPLFAPSSKTNEFWMHDLYINVNKMLASRNTQTIKLNRREIDILKLFYNMAGKVVSRNTLLNHCWGHDHFPNSRSLDQYISSLRSKIELDPKYPQIIKTARGVGYSYKL